MGEVPTDDDLLLKGFFAEVGEVERDNEVLRFFLALSLHTSVPYAREIDTIYGFTWFIMRLGLDSGFSWWIIRVSRCLSFFSSFFSNFVCLAFYFPTDSDYSYWWVFLWLWLGFAMNFWHSWIEIRLSVAYKATLMDIKVLMSESVPYWREVFIWDFSNYWKWNLGIGVCIKNIFFCVEQLRRKTKPRWLVSESTQKTTSDSFNISCYVFGDKFAD